MNPYQHLAVKVRRLLGAEARLSAEERKRNQWSLLTEFCGHKVIVGKADVNTMFYQIGEGQRKLCYPDDLLARLDKLGREPYWRYEVVGAERKFTNTLAAAQRDPVVGTVIYGLDEGRTKIYKVVKPLVGQPKWVKA